MTSPTNDNDGNTQVNEDWIYLPVAVSPSPCASDNNSEASTVAPHPIVLARLIPHNDAARLAFQEIAQACRDEKLALHHVQYLAFHDWKNPRDDAPITHLYPQSLQGHFEIQLNEQLLKTGLRLGKGSSKFPDHQPDLLLIVPTELRSTATQQNARSIAALHCHIRMHPGSGALLLSLGTSRSPNLHLMVNLQSLSKTKPSNVLYNDRSELEIGDLVYRFERATNIDDRAFLKHRNALLHKHHPESPLPHPKLCMTPLQEFYDEAVGTVFGQEIGRGTFGTVFAGVLLDTGEPIAIKYQYVANEHAAGSIRSEAQTGCDLQRSVGLMGSISTSCLHGSEQPCGIYPENFYTIMELGLQDFQMLRGRKFPLRQLAKLFHDTLRGVEGLHAKGFIHSDISLKNLLVLALDPIPTAAVCDFGKLSRNATNSDTFIGPPNTLAPEIPGNQNGDAPADGGKGIDGNGNYNQKIDIWSLAYAWYQVLSLPLPSTKTRIGLGAHKTMMDSLLEWGKEDEEQGDMADLMNKMMAWDHAKRLSAQEALEHCAMDWVKTEWATKDTGEIMTKKRSGDTLTNARGKNIQRSSFHP